jgi:hypothetical protein
MAYSGASWVEGAHTFSCFSSLFHSLFLSQPLEEELNFFFCLILILMFFWQFDEIITGLLKIHAFCYNIFILMVITNCFQNVVLHYSFCFILNFFFSLIYYFFDCAHMCKCVYSCRIKVVGIFY